MAGEGDVQPLQDVQLLQRCAAAGDSSRSSCRHVPAAPSALAVISVGIGAVVKAVPATLEQSEAIGRWLGAALLLYFGVRTLQDAWAQPVDSGTGDELEEAEQSGEAPCGIH